jgi:hypothetical protein
MLIDMLSTSNQVSFNIKLAEILGLHAAIYISELMNIYVKAEKKNKLENNHFKLVRSYMTSRTTLDESEQIEIEEYLLKLGVVDKGEEPDTLSLNITNLTAIMMSPDEQMIDKAKKKRKPRTTKTEKIKEALKARVTVQNQELKEAYYGWIDSVYDRQGWMTGPCVDVAQKTVDEFSNRNLDVALKLIEIASVHGHRDIQWAINKYNQEFMISYSTTPEVRRVATRCTQLSSEVF